MKWHPPTHRPCGPPLVCPIAPWDLITGRCLRASARPAAHSPAGASRTLGTRRPILNREGCCLQACHCFQGLFFTKKILFPSSCPLFLGSLQKANLQACHCFLLSHNKICLCKSFSLSNQHCLVRGCLLSTMKIVPPFLLIHSCEAEGCLCPFTFAYFPHFSARRSSEACQKNQGNNYTNKSHL